MVKREPKPTCFNQVTTWWCDSCGEQVPVFTKPAGADPDGWDLVCAHHHIVQTFIVKAVTDPLPAVNPDCQDAIR